MSAHSSISLTEFAAATLHSCADSNLNSKDESMTTILSSVLPPLADLVDRLLKHRELFILHRYREQRSIVVPKLDRPSSTVKASDHSLHFFDAHTLTPVRIQEKACQLPDCISDSCYLPHGFGRNKPALVVATSVACDLSKSWGWAPTIFVLDGDFNLVTPPASAGASEVPVSSYSVCPHPSEPSVVMCASEYNHCVMCLNIATGEWSRFGSSSEFRCMEALVALPSCGLLAVGSYTSDLIAVCDLNEPTTYEDVDCSRFKGSQSDMCSTSFAALGDHYFLCMVDWGLGVYDALSRKQIGFFALEHQDQESCGCGGLVKTLEVPRCQQSTTLGLFLVFHHDLLQIVRCDHQLQWSVVNDRGPLLEALGEDGFEVQFFASL